VVELPGRTAEQIKDLKSLIERNGQLEFRIAAEASEQRKWQDIWEASGQKVAPPPEYMFVPRSSPAFPTCS